MSRSRDIASCLHYLRVLGGLRDFGLPRRGLRAGKFSKRNEGGQGWIINGSDDEVRPKKSDPIQP
jgi:hypothetical protein